MGIQQGRTLREMAPSIMTVSHILILASLNTRFTTPSLLPSCFLVYSEGFVKSRLCSASSSYVDVHYGSTLFNQGAALFTEFLRYLRVLLLQIRFCPDNEQFSTDDRLFMLVPD